MKLGALFCVCQCQWLVVVVIVMEWLVHTTVSNSLPFNYYKVSISIITFQVTAYYKQHLTRTYAVTSRQSLHVWVWYFMLECIHEYGYIHITGSVKLWRWQVFPSLLWCSNFHVLYPEATVYPSLRPSLSQQSPISPLRVYLPQLLSTQIAV